MSAIIEVKYFNSFWAKSVEQDAAGTPGFVESDPTWPSMPWNPYGYPQWPLAAKDTTGGSAVSNWYIEEARIKGGYNNTMVSQGVRAYANEESPDQDSRASSLIYSGIYNSRNDVNRTNVFSTGELIIKTLDPSYGSIQKLFAEETNLTIFQEDKVSQALIDKDAIYSAEGQGQPVSTQNLVIGQVVPYLGRYGIGKNPESFAQFGFRKYFVDPVRTTVMRLSRDGLTEISEYGMKDYFRDILTTFNSNWNSYLREFTLCLPDEALENTRFITIPDENICNIYLGSRVYQKNSSGAIRQTDAIVIDIQPNTGTPNYCGTPSGYTIELNIPIQVDNDFGTGWNAGYFVYDYKQRIIGTWDNYNKYYTTSLQPTPTYVENNSTYNTLSYDDSVRGWVSFFTFKPSFGFSIKGQFYTIKDSSSYLHYSSNINENYGVFYGVANSSLISFVVNQNPSTKKVFKTISYEGDNGWFVSDLKTDTTGVDLSPNEVNSDGGSVIYSYEEGLYTDSEGYTFRAGFDRKENLYVANINNSALFQNNQVLEGSSMTGVKGYFITVEMKTDSTTDVNGKKELWAVNTNFVQSS